MDPQAKEKTYTDTEVERLEVRWPSGLVQRFEHVKSDRFLLIEEGEGIRPISAGSGLQ